MDNLSDYDIRNPQPPPGGVAPPPRQPMTPWIAGVVVLVVLAGATYIWFTRDRGLPPEDTAVVAAPEPEAARPLGAEPEPIDLPPLAESDPLVRDLVRALSSHPRVAAWLATDNLIRNFTVVVENIASGSNPSNHLRVLQPAGAFRVIEGEGEGPPRVDSRSYQRYSTIADAVSGLDAAGTARLYATLKPRIEDAYRELGHQDTFDDALERAIVALLRVPVLQPEVPLVVKGGVFAYADPRIEGLTPAQRQFLRMGPRNVEIIQGKLREIAVSLGIPPARLPPPSAS